MQDVANTIHKAMKGEKIADNDIDNDVEQSDNEVEVINRPPAASTSYASGSSHKSASAARTAPDTTATSKKIIRTYSGKKQQTHNLKTTGDNEGKIFDCSSVIVDNNASQPEAEDQDNGATVTSSTSPHKDMGKQKDTGKAKGKEKVVDEDNEEGTSVPLQPKQKTKLKDTGRKRKRRSKRTLTWTTTRRGHLRRHSPSKNPGQS